MKVIMYACKQARMRSGRHAYMLKLLRWQSDSFCSSILLAAVVIRGCIGPLQLGSVTSCQRGKVQHHVQPVGLRDARSPKPLHKARDPERPVVVKPCLHGSGCSSILQYRSIRPSSRQSIEPEFNDR